MCTKKGMLFFKGIFACMIFYMWLFSIYFTICLIFVYHFYSSKTVMFVCLKPGSQTSRADDYLIENNDTH